MLIFKKVQMGKRILKFRPTALKSICSGWSLRDFLTLGHFIFCISYHKDRNGPEILPIFKWVKKLLGLLVQWRVKNKKRKMERKGGLY